MFRVLCGLAIIGVFLVAMSAGKSYSNSWAVQVDGPRELADELAGKHGFINHGVIGNLKNIYHFELVEGKKEIVPDKTMRLKEEPAVLYVKQQEYRKMVKKGPR